MHAVVVTVTVRDGEAATQHLREQVVPNVSNAPGFVAGYWVRIEGGDQGRSTIVCESEDAAKSIAEKIVAPENGAVEIDSVQLGEVVANA